MTREKKKTRYGLLVLLSLLLGLGIQFLLGYTLHRQDSARNAVLLEELKSSARTAAGAELDRRSQLEDRSRPLLFRITGERLAAREKEQPELLRLVNGANPLPEDFSTELTQVEEKDGRRYELDSRCAQAFWDLMADCAAAGGEPYICSGFGTRADQEKLYQDKIKRLVEAGVSPEEAPLAAAAEVAPPGCSEHELGLAADIIDESYPYLDELQEKTPTQLWLMENAWRYGFILRYPNGSTAWTGVIFEPWHYRYVGPVYAEEIHRLGLTLEEYLQRREGR
jgi:D-alanyl-D-alanine carboxypeptidase